MLPSDILRADISQKYNVDLEQYVWSDDFKKLVFSTKLDKTLEESADTLGEIYLHGFNIGHCGLTSRYIARQFDEASLYYGKAKLLVGTNNAPNGEHAWTCIRDFLIDSTLMICVPLSKASDFGYVAEKEIEHDCARLLSEYDIYEIEFKNTDNNDSSLALKLK